LRDTVGEDAWELDDLGDPAAVGLLFNLDAEVNGQGDLLKVLEGYYAGGSAGRVTLPHLTLCT
jgi:hypothetical protein